MTVPSNARPPAARSAAALGLLRGAASGGFILQECADCATVQYPPRDVCHACLSTNLDWEHVDPSGTLCAVTTIRVSNEPYFQSHLPWTIGIIAAAAGPSIVAHLLPGCVVGAPVTLDLRLDAAGRGVMVARPAGPGTNSGFQTEPGAHRTDTLPSLSEAPANAPTEANFFNTPSGRRLLVTDGCSALGQYVIAALLKRGAAYIAAGCPREMDTCSNDHLGPRVGWFTVNGGSRWPSPEWYLAAGLETPGNDMNAPQFDAVFDTTS
jgi:uncharacterized OB-fold protein